MATFLINTHGDMYQEILRVDLIIEARNRNGKFTFEKRPADGVFQKGDFKNQYLLSNMDDILTIEDLYKKELYKVVIEQRDRKVANHRAQTSNIVLNINGVEAFDMKKFGALWELNDETVKEKIDIIQFSLIGNGKVFSIAPYEEYLI